MEYQVTYWVRMGDPNFDFVESDDHVFDTYEEAMRFGEAKYGEDFAGLGRRVKLG